MSFAWTGRVDEDGGLRWHQIVGAEPGPGLALLGYPCDEGVARNQGRIGAPAGPNALRQAMANLPAFERLKLADLGDAVGNSVEEFQSDYSGKAAEAMRRDQVVIGLGGGHDIALASASALYRVSKKRIGLLNIDAHFDVRRADQPTSGTSFRMALESRAVSCLMIGISETGNTTALFDQSAELGVECILDREAGNSLPRLTDWLAGIDDLYLSIDLDVLPGESAPGVSAPASLGVPLSVVEHLVEVAAGSGKLRIADIAELNPSLDIDHRTARAGARLAWRLARSLTK